MRFTLAGSFLDILVFTQVVYIGGRPGGGKTALGYMLAAWLLSNRMVDRVVSNIPMWISSPVTVPLQRTAIILDESWIYLSDRASVFAYAGFVRKDEDYLILPAVYPVHRLLMRFTVERVLNLYAFGFPAWVYKWRLDRLNVKEAGHFAVVNPHHAFGQYDTKAKPKNDGGIVKAIKQTSGEIFEDGAAIEKQEDDQAKEQRYVEILEDVLDQADEQGKRMEDVVKNIKKVRR